MFSCVIQFCYSILLYGLVALPFVFVIRTCGVLRGGDKGKGKNKPTHFAMTPRAAGTNPWASGADPWSTYDRTASGDPANVYQGEPTWHRYSQAPSGLAERAGDRRTVIIGGFPCEAGRADIEQALRAITTKDDGLERVSSMDKYGSCGEIIHTYIHTASGVCFSR